jgi:hypothetical protein
LSLEAGPQRLSRSDFVCWSVGIRGSRLLRRRSLPAVAPPRVLGRDDWAWRKGRRYGTILCDLERHGLIDLLPDCAAEL